MSARRFLGLAGLLVTLSMGTTSAASAPALPPAGTPSDTWDLIADVVMTADSDGDLPAVDLVGGTGTFNYSALAGGTACVVNSVGEGVPPATEAGLCSISGRGTYTNVVCATGSATGTINSIAVDKGTGTFSAVFVFGIGVLTGTFTDTPSADDPADTPDNLVGLVVLAPPAGAGRPDDAFDCTEGFTANAHITGTD
jgi:hypothetical protein